MRGAFFVAQEVAQAHDRPRRRRSARHFTGGRIVNIASMAGLRVLPQIGVYCMSKAAVVHMTTRAWRWSGAATASTSTPSAPATSTPRSTTTTGRPRPGQKLMQMLPRKRVGDAAGPRRRAAAAGAPTRAHFINGAVIAADDGMSVT
ncbi:MAG: SDR family oxidoreductase [Comamonadaceae bacterium]|nr:SDR family oxidoreductase [Comamonadaceae bacterium]